MGRIIGIVMVACGASLWYVMAHGLEHDYAPLGSDGPVLSGSKVAAAALAALIGLLVLATGLLRFSIPSILIGAVLVFGAGSVVWNDVAEPDGPAGWQTAAACQHLLTDNPDLVRRLAAGEDQADVLAEVARARALSGVSASDRRCLVEVNNWAAEGRQ